MDESKYQGTTNFLIVGTFIIFPSFELSFLQAMPACLQTIHRTEGRWKLGHPDVYFEGDEYEESLDSEFSSSKKILKVTWKAQNPKVGKNSYFVII
jgi:hypothetical protein